MSSDTCRLTNIGTQADSFALFVHSDLPDTFLTFFCSSAGMCYGDSMNFLFTPDSTAGYYVDVQTDYLPAEFVSGTVYFTAASLKDPTKSRTLEYVFTYVPPPRLLIDANRAIDSMAFWEQSLARLGESFFPWDLFYHGSLRAEEMDTFSTILWNGGQSSRLSAQAELSITQFLEKGKRLLLSSQDYVLYAPPAGNAFTGNILHLSEWTEDVGCSQALGVSLDDIGNGLTLPLDFGTIGYQDWSDQLSEDQLASVAFTNPGLQPCGTHYYSGSADSFASVFLAFPFEAIGDPALRDTLLQRILAWLDSPTPTGISGDVPVDASPSTPALLRAYPNPFRSTTQIRFLQSNSSITRNPSPVTFRVFNLSGQLVRSETFLPSTPGPQTFRWDGRDERGRRLGSGVYLCRVDQGRSSAYGRAVLLH
jgi:hypothetical protein